ncbi:iron ABC transporter permease, partial [Candidatus Bathyarchaeota archaeon]|nr:iron ABC transporter permease [Candidatus Bathyarchaeota archaeon]
MRTEADTGPPGPGLRPYIPQIIMFIVLFSPLTYLVVLSARGIVTEPSLLSLLIPSGRRLGLFMKSLGLSAAVSVAGTALGVLAGSLLWEYGDGPASRLRWWFLALAPVPPYIHALSWMTAASFLSTRLGVKVLSSGWGMSFWVGLMAYLPYAVGLTLIGLNSVETPAVEAARTVHGDGRVFREVVLPLAAPALASAACLLFVFTVTDYSVPTLFSYNVYALEVFSDFSATNMPARAALLSAPLVAVTLGALMLSQRALRNTVQSSSVSGRSLRLMHPAWFRVLQHAAFIVLLLQSAVLLWSLLVELTSLSDFMYSVGSAGASITFTVTQSSLTGLLCLPVAYAAAERLRGGEASWWLLVTSPLAVPASLVGVGLIALHSRVGPLYGTLALPVLATLTRFTPLAALVILAQLQKSDPLLLDAARVFQRDWVQALREVRLPLQAPGLAAAAALVFAFTMGELGGTLLTLPPGSESVTIRVFNYLHYGGSADVAGL